MIVSKSYINKLVTFVDRYFTYDTREMRREGTSCFDFYGLVHNEDGTITSVAIDHGYNYIFVSINSHNKGYEYHKLTFKYSEITEFKRMVRCLG